jgi:hypothetical protein
MAGSLLEPRSLMRAAKRYGVRLQATQADQICALLEVSRGITVIGRGAQIGQLADAIVDSASESGASRAALRFTPELTDDEVLLALQRGEWLVLGSLSGEELQRVVWSIARLIAAEGGKFPRSTSEERPAWRVVLTHEPTPGRMLPPIPRELRRHFPLVKIGEGD